MLVNSKQDATQVHEAFSIHLQCFDRGPPARGQSQDECSVFIPDEVVRPALMAGMKQGADYSSHRISRSGFIVFVIVALLASPGEVGQIRFPSIASRYDVFGGKR